MLTLKITRQKNQGFSLVELMTVTAIMLLLASAFVININSTRDSRNIKIGQSELVSNIRKTQSYTLSSRILPNGNSAQYYLIKFDLASSRSQYKIQAIYDADSSPKLTDVETINLPPNIEIATTSTATYAIHISRSLNPTLQPIYSNCALAAFAAPYGKIIFNDGCNLTLPNNLPTLYLADDYWSKIINFQNNIACDGNNGNPENPPGCRATTDAVMTITLTNKARTLYKNVYINGVTGAVIFN